MDAKHSPGKHSPKKSPEQQNLLFKICSQNDSKRLKHLIKDGVDLHIVDSEMRTLLHHCFQSEDIGCARLLLDYAKSLIDKKDIGGFTALHLCVMVGNRQLAEFLVDQGTNLNAKDHEGRTALHWAVISYQTELIDLLLRQGAELSAADIHGARPIHYATRAFLSPYTEEKGVLILRLLLDKGNVPIDCVDKESKTPLSWAASLGLLQCSSILCHAGASLNHADEDGLLPIHIAASKGHLELVEFFVNNQAGLINSVDKNGCTPLFYAVTFDHNPTVSYLILKGSDVNKQDINGFTPLHCAAVMGNCEVADTLLRHGASPTISNHNQDTPIHEACEAGHVDMAQLLVKNLDDGQRVEILNAINTNGLNCFDLAVSSGVDEAPGLVSRLGGVPSRTHKSERKPMQTNAKQRRHSPSEEVNHGESSPRLNTSNNDQSAEIITIPSGQSENINHETTSFPSLTGKNLTNDNNRKKNIRARIPRAKSEPEELKLGSMSLQSTKVRQDPKSKKRHTDRLAPPFNASYPDLLQEEKIQGTLTMKSPRIKLKLPKLPQLPIVNCYNSEHQKYHKLDQLSLQASPRDHQSVTKSVLEFEAIRHVARDMIHQRMQEVHLDNIATRNFAESVRREQEISQQSTSTRVSRKVNGRGSSSSYHSSGSSSNQTGGAADLASLRHGKTKTGGTSSNSSEISAENNNYPLRRRNRKKKRDQKLSTLQILRHDSIRKAYAPFEFL